MNTLAIPFGVSAHLTTALHHVRKVDSTLLGFTTPAMLSEIPGSIDIAIAELTVVKAAIQSTLEETEQ